MSAIGQAIRQLRKEQGLTLEELSEKMGMSIQSIQRRETGNAEVKPPERKAFAAAFGMSVDEFDQRWRATRIEQTRGGTGIPVINRAPAGSIIDYEEFGVDSGQGYEYIDYGGLPENEHLFAVVIVGDSMTPTLQDGDRVIFRPLDSYRPRTKWEDGRVCFVRFNEDYDEPGCTVARVRSTGNGHLMLIKDNPAHSARIVGREMISQIAVAVERRSSHQL
jgi:transcriptional regulator with XRE-family HTH domain